MKSICVWLIAVASLTAPPPVEIEWHPVEQLISSVEHVKLPNAKDPKAPTTVIIVTGLMPQKRQVATVAATLQIPSDKASELIEVTDFVIERQDLSVSDTPPPKSPEWKGLDLKDATRILEQSKADQAELVPVSQLNPVFSMPLPGVVGAWPKCVVHPKLTADHQLFRFIDFTAKPGHHYRYRVRLEFINPKFGDSPDPFIAAGEARHSPWSLPSPTVTLAP